MKDLEKLNSLSKYEWNAWRAENTEPNPDISCCDLSERNLSGYNLKNTNMLSSNLSGTDLSGSDLSGAKVNDANLESASLVGANLSTTLFIQSILDHANLRQANINGTEFNFASLENANLEKASIYRAVFASTNLNNATGLESCIHGAPSSIDSETLALSGKIPEKFLRGCGLSDWLIDAYSLIQPDLSNDEVISISYRLCNKRIGQVIQISPLFISYSHVDSAFVDYLGEKLDAKGVRYWRDIHNAPAGRMEKIVDRAIRVNPIVLLILSENSINSDWVEHEVRTARKLEKEMDKDVICPICLDDSWKTSKWPMRLREQIEEYNILDFSEWENEQKFNFNFDRLLHGISINYDSK